MRKITRITQTMYIDIEDDCHKVEEWKTILGVRYFYVVDLVKCAGECKILFDTEGNVVLQLLPKDYTPLSSIYWSSVSEICQSED